EIIDAPDQPALGVSPAAEILEMKVADAEQARRAGQLRTMDRKQLHPAIEGGAQEGEGILRHVAMLLVEIRLDHFAVAAQPGFIGIGRGDDGSHLQPPVLPPPRLPQTAARGKALAARSPLSP